jgi:hypothetical protein
MLQMPRGALTGAVYDAPRTSLQRHYAADSIVNSKSFAALGRLLPIKVNATSAPFPTFINHCRQAESLKF